MSSRGSSFVCSARERRCGRRRTSKRQVRASALGRGWLSHRGGDCSQKAECLQMQPDVWLICSRLLDRDGRWDTPLRGSSMAGELQPAEKGGGTGVMNRKAQRRTWPAIFWPRSAHVR